MPLLRILIVMKVDAQIIEFLKSTPASVPWQDIGICHHHGIDLPLASLHSTFSHGIGQFSDLLPLIDWCSDVGFDVIQLLPLNDSGLDASPYNALSALALHPIYLDFHRLPNVNTLLPSDELKKTKRIDYLAIRDYKERFFQVYCLHEGASIAATQAYQDFINHNPWLQSYALFKVLKNQHEQKHWKKWPKEHREPTQAVIDELLEKHHQEIRVHYLEQFFCSQQMHQVKEYAEEKGIFIKGDIPILISADSADAWRHPEYFLPSLCAGAPPDAYSRQGQKWGFPIYDWKALANDNYSWWKMRLDVAGRFYHLYRLDHIIGFFRIWAIPPHRSAKAGFFIPENKEEWLPQGEKILTMMLKHSHMLPIGEDLGVDPQQVRPSMQRLGICGTKVVRWERHWEEDQSFIPLEEYSAESMTTVSTHDSETLQQWWKQQPQEAKVFAEFKDWDYNEDLNEEQRKTILKDSHHSGSLFHINLLQEYLALIPELVWPSINDERINVPGIISKKNWTYRFRPTVEQIVSNKDLRSHITDILADD